MILNLLQVKNVKCELPIDATKDDRRKNRNLKKVVTYRLAAALDTNQLSNRKAMHLLAVATEAFQISANDFALNMSSTV